MKKFFILVGFCVSTITMEQSFTITSKQIAANNFPQDIQILIANDKKLLEFLPQEGADINAFDDKYKTILDRALTLYSYNDHQCLEQRMNDEKQKYSSENRWYYNPETQILTTHVSPEEHENRMNNLRQQLIKNAQAMKIIIPFLKSKGALTGEQKYQQLQKFNVHFGLPRL